MTTVFFTDADNTLFYARLLLNYYQWADHPLSFSKNLSRRLSSFRLSLSLSLSLHFRTMCDE